MDDARAKELLGAERARIEESLGRLTGEFRPGVPEPSDDDLDYGDRAVDLDDRERDLTRIEELRRDLAAVERAEARLAEGTYGLSIVTVARAARARRGAAPRRCARRPGRSRAAAPRSARR